MGERITIEEAAQRLGITIEAVKRQIRSGELKGLRENKAQWIHWLVELPDEPAMAAADEPLPADDEPEPPAPDPRLALLAQQDQLTALQAELATLQQDVAALRQEVAELRAHLAARPAGGTPLQQIPDFLKRLGNQGKQQRRRNR